MTQREFAAKIAHLRNLSPRFVDYLGRETEVAEENIHLILKAMGYRLDDPEQLERDAWQLDRAQWFELLEPVSVISPFRGHFSNLYLLDTDKRQPAQWQVQCEDGGELSQGFDASALYESGEYWMESGRYCRLQLPLPESLPLGYHRLTVQVGDRTQTAALIVTPATSFQPDTLADGSRIWGTAIQLYTLRSERNWGVGDFTDLADLLERLSAQGADVVGLNPIHSLYPISPEHASPYSPSNRSYINPLYVDIEQVPEFADSARLKRRVAGKTFQKKLAALRATEDVHYTGVSDVKYAALRDLYEAYKKKHAGKGTERERAFLHFVEAQGTPLLEHSTFEALLVHFKAEDSQAWGWPMWPQAYQNHHSAEVQAFIEANPDEIAYRQYLQFIADEQLQQVDQRAKALGMKIGLYRDLAVGADRGGAEVWGNRESFCLDASVGAPPDALGPNGQNWGLPPLDPVKLKRDGYQTFITLLRNNMRACGALRIDHAMALLRLWWCPPGKSAAYGAYVYYDLFDMLGILNLESQRNRTMVIAEDLGTVPPEVVEYFPKAELYSNKVFYFEIGDAGCTPVETYAEKALAIVCNHDMPTVHAFWQMSDLALRWDLGMFASEADYESERHQRQLAKQAIVDALIAYGLLPDGVPEQASDLTEMTLPLCLAIHTLLAKSRSQIIAVQLEDLMLINKPVNIPGTSDEYPNWRRKLTEPVETLLKRPEIKAFCADLGRVRRQAPGSVNVV
ncbi:MAG: 4-alpha-glucanotransferase [Saccharospirillum sp.]